MVNTADIRSSLGTIEEREHELALIKAFRAKGGAYKLGMTVDVKNDWESAQIAAVVNRHVSSLPILATVEARLEAEISTAKKALVNLVGLQKANDKAAAAGLNMSAHTPEVRND